MNIDAQVDALVAALGRAIRIHREGLGMTQDRLAERSGRSANWVSEVERGQGRPKLETYVRLSIGLGISVASLFLEASASTDEDPVLTELRARLGRLSRRDLILLNGLAKMMETMKG